jgi:hypothetical protein
MPDVQGWHTMTTAAAKIVGEVKALPEKEFEEFLAWLAECGLQHNDRWDQGIERDSQPSGRLDGILRRVRTDISAGRTKPLDEVIRHP